MPQLQNVKTHIPCAVADAEGGYALSVHQSVTDAHDLAPACLSELVYSVTTHSAVVLEAVLPPRPAQAVGPLQMNERTGAP